MVPESPWSSPSSPLACTVRGCGLQLVRDGRVFRCAGGHAYDVARSGRLNLLQPQDRRSLAAGDGKEAVAARARLMDRGIGRAIVDGVAAQVVALDLPDHSVVVDLGSGTGHVLSAVAAARPMVAIGIDLSAAAGDYAARRFPPPLWITANADRRLPLADCGVTLVISVHGRRNPVECARVLAPGGFLLVAVPAPDDLIELRTLVGGARVERARDDSVLRDHAAGFVLIDRRRMAGRHLLDRDAVVDVLRSTYRGARHRTAAAVAALTSLNATVASDLFVFERR